MILKLLEELVKSYGVKKVLLAAPPSAISGWVGHIADWGESWVFNFYSGTRDAFEAWSKAERGLFLTSYHILNDSKGKTKYLHHSEVKDCDVLVCDESHYCKNYSAARTQFMLKLSKRVPYRYILTGTPTGGNEMDYYTQMRILSPTIFDNFTLTQFRAAFFHQAQIWGAKQGDFDEGCREEFDKRIKANSSSLRLKDVNKNLPETLYVPIPLEPTEEIIKTTERLKNDFIVELQGREVTAITAGAAIMKFNQIANGHCIDDTGRSVVFADNPKLRWLAENLPKITQKDKVIIWCIFKQDWRNVLSTLSAIRIPYVHYRSGMTTTERGKRLDRFRERESSRVIVAHQDSAGMGVNLPVAPIIIVYSRNYNYLSFAQALARNSARVLAGGDRTVYDLVVKGTADEKIFDILKQKGEKLGKDMAKYILKEILDL